MTILLIRTSFAGIAFLILVGFSIKGILNLYVEVGSVPTGTIAGWVLRII